MPESLMRTLQPLESRVLFAAHIGSTSYSTIQAAVNAAAVGSIITVDAGTYTESVTVNKTLTIRGAQYGKDARSRSGSETIVTGPKGSAGIGPSFYITAIDVVIDGFTVQGETSQSTSNGAGIVMAPTIHGTQILNNIIQNNVAGVYLANSSAADPVVFQYNLFQNNNNNGVNGGRGIYTDGSLTNGYLSGVEIDNNTFTNNRGGSGTTGLEAAVAFEASSSSSTQSQITISNNTFINNGKSTLFFNSTNVLIEGNTASGAADWYSGSLRFEGNNHNVTIVHNNIINNPGPGVAVDSSGVTGDSSGFVVNYNNIQNNGTNTTYRNRLGVVFNENEYDGTFDARYNYWNSTTGPGGDGKGSGDGLYGNAYKTGNWIYALGATDDIYSPFSTTAVSTAIAALPSAASNLSATASGTSSVKLSWTIGANATGTQIERSTDNNTWSVIGTVGSGVTSFSDGSVSAGNTYYYRVRSTNSTGLSGASSVASVSSSASNYPGTYLSDLSYVSGTTGYGSIMKDKSVSGNTLTLNGVTYTKGIGTHASSVIVYNLGGQYQTFQSAVGIDAEEDSKGTGHVEFEVIGDGKTLFDSGVLTNDQVKQINISVAGVQQLTIEALPGVAGSIDYDHSDFAGAILYGTASAPTAPSSLAATPLSASSIKLTWTPGSSNLTSYTIQRSTDGTNFSNLATGVAATSTTYTDSSVMSASTKYYYRIAAVNSIGTSPYSNLASATTGQLQTVTYVSDLSSISATTGYGTIMKDKSVNGNTLTLAGQTYSKGIGAHAVSQITYNIAGKYSTFVSDVGVDQEEDGKGVGTVDFQVFGDGKLLYDSGNLTNDQVAHINISVAGVQTLEAGRQQRRREQHRLRPR